MAQPFSFSSILSRYTSGAASGPSSTPQPTNNVRPDVPPKSTNTRPASVTPASSNTTTVRVAPPNPRIPRESRDSPSSDGAVPKKRKLNHPPKADRPLTAQEKEMEERKKKLMEKLKAKQEREQGAAVGGSNTGSATKPSADQKAAANKLAPAKGTGGSYKEMLARAAQLQAGKKSMPGTITHKARTPPAGDKKRQLGKLNGKDGPSVPRDRNSKSPGVISGGEKSGKVSESSKLKKATASSISGDARPKEPRVERKQISDVPLHKRMGASASASSSKTSNKNGLGKKRSYSSAQRRSRYDDEYDNDDGWLVDDGDDNGGGGGGYGSRYRYVSSDYDSESDMEAGGADVLEEEERSRRQAIKEDLAEEKRLKELAARKAALKQGKK